MVSCSPNKKLKSTAIHLITAAAHCLRSLILLAFLLLTCAGQGQSRVHEWAGNQWLRAHEAGHIPEPPDMEAKLQNPSRSLSVAMCASMKSENMTDVREWLLYYRWLGVEHAYLTENRPGSDPAIAQQLRDFISSGFVTYSHEPLPQAQMKVYYDCLAKHAHKHDWMAFFDMDEFLVLISRPDQKLPEFLRAYSRYPGLAVHWVIVGPSQRVPRPRSGGVLRHYAQCAGRGAAGIKTIVNTLFVSNIAMHPHNFEFRDGMPAVDENFEPVGFNPHLNHNSRCSPIPPARSVPGSAAARLTDALPFARGEVWMGDGGKFCYPVPLPAKVTASAARVGLFHYVTKSQQDFLAKMERGAGIGPSKAWEFLLNTTREATQWGGLCAEAPRLAAACCPEEAYMLPVPRDGLAWWATGRGARMHA